MTEEPGSRSAADTAADKVRAIVEAAERSASELEEAARAEATRIRADAERETETQLRRIQEAADRLSERADELENALEGLAGRVRAAIVTLREDLRELRNAGGTQTEQREAPTSRTDVAPDPPKLEPAPKPEPPPEAPEKQASARAAGGSEGARVIALNMALNGSTREETARYLAENFELDDPEALLDDVYARAGG